MSYVSPAGGLAIQANTDTMIEATADPDEIRRMSENSDGHHKGIRERAWGLEARTDPTVTFEEFVYWAKIERAMEIEENKEYKARQGPWSILSVVKNRFSKGVHHENAKREREEKVQRERAVQVDDEGKTWQRDEKSSDDEFASKVHNNLDVVAPPAAASEAVFDKDAEWRQSARALRTASWGTIFYLVTTDILGWSSTP